MALSLSYHLIILQAGKCSLPSTSLCSTSPTAGRRDGEPEKYWEARETHKKYGERLKKRQGRKSRVIKLSWRRRISHKFCIFSGEVCTNKNKGCFKKSIVVLIQRFGRRHRGHFKSYTLQKYAFPRISRDKKQTVKKRSRDSPEIRKSQGKKR